MDGHERQEFRFDGKVAIVTGAGNNPSLGRSYARLFAQRGASVVVNDLGVGSDGRGRVLANAVAVAEEIVDEGGVAVADTNSVAEHDSAQAIVRTALDAFGRVDILVNNAGVVNHAPFEALSENDVRRMVGVHLFGTFWMCQAVWPHMREQGYGRIVNISSGTIFGLPHVTAYGAAKAGVLGLARNLAVEGQPHGIKVNTVTPAAGGTSISVFNAQETEWTRMMNEKLPPDLVAPAVAFLCHEGAPCTGKFLDVGGGKVREVLLSETLGFEDPNLTIETLAANWDRVTDRTDATVLVDAVEYAPPPWVTNEYVPS